jgi:hypothetical protein
MKFYTVFDRASGKVRASGVPREELGQWFLEQKETPTYFDDDVMLLHTRTDLAAIRDDQYAAFATRQGWSTEETEDGLDPPPVAAIRRVVDHFWNGEKHHFQTCSPEEKERHIWHALVEVNEWLAKTK